jgi:hypothetical protein
MTTKTDHLETHAEDRDLTVLLTSNVAKNLDLRVSGKLITNSFNEFDDNLIEELTYEAAAKRDQYAMHDYPEGLLLNFSVHIELIDSITTKVVDDELAMILKKRTKKYGNHEGQLMLDFCQITKEVIVEDDLPKKVICKNSKGIINLLDEDCSILDDFLRITKKPHFVNRILSILKENGIDLEKKVFEFKVETPNLH